MNYQQPRELTRAERIALVAAQVAAVFVVCVLIYLGE